MLTHADFSVLASLRMGRHSGDKIITPESPGFCSRVLAKARGLGRPRNTPATSVSIHIRYLYLVFLYLNANKCVSVDAYSHIDRIGQPLLI